MLTAADYFVPARLGRVWVADMIFWAQDFTMSIAPQGGQSRSRRNAWRAMAVEAALAAQRRESDAAMRGALERARLHDVAVRAAVAE